jgi:hypothetical protein
VSKKKEMNRLAFIAGLRMVADFLENNPQFRAPAKHYTISVNCLAQEDVEALGLHAKMMGSCRKVTGMWDIGLEKDFGTAVTLKVKWPKWKTCKKVKVPGEVETEYVYRHMEKVERPKYKWVCPESFINACCEEK